MSQEKVEKTIQKITFGLHKKGFIIPLIMNVQIIEQIGNG